jgi:hypoxanthine-guanine phosphoribosyltransferase
MYKDAYVLIVDDICDTGKTLLQLSTKMKELEVKKVWISVLVSRPDKFHET